MWFFTRRVWGAESTSRSLVCGIVLAEQASQTLPPVYGVSLSPTCRGAKG